MSLQNIKNMKSERGFTIVELLIVIVVIAILAAITIVAYNGIQNRANNTAAQEVANQLRTKVEAYNTIHGSYPTDTDDLADYDETKLDAGLTDKLSSTAAGVSKGDPVHYAPCGAPTGTEGGIVTYWQATGGNKTYTVGSTCSS